MVNPSGNVGYQQFAAQPAVVNATDPPVRQETVQPRQAPAADSQRQDQKSLASRDEQRPPDRQPAKADSDRGRSLDVAV